MENKASSIIQNSKTLDDYFFSRFTGHDPFSVWMILSYVKFSISRLRDYETAEFGITPEQNAILHIIDRKAGKASIGEIADSWIRRENSVLTMVRRMEKLGLVSIIKYPKRKELEVVMTNKGREVLGKITYMSTETAFSVLSQEEMQKLSLYLRLVLSRSQNMLKLIEEK